MNHNANNSSAGLGLGIITGILATGLSLATLFGVGMFFYSDKNLMDPRDPMAYKICRDDVAFPVPPNAKLYYSANKDTCWCEYDK